MQRVKRLARSIGVSLTPREADSNFRLILAAFNAFTNGARSEADAPHQRVPLSCIDRSSKENTCREQPFVWRGSPLLELSAARRMSYRRRPSMVVQDDGTGPALNQALSSRPRGVEAAV